MKYSFFYFFIICLIGNYALADTIRVVKLNELTITEDSYGNCEDIVKKLESANRGFLFKMKYICECDENGQMQLKTEASITTRDSFIWGEFTPKKAFLSFKLESESPELVDSECDFYRDIFERISNEQVSVKPGCGTLLPDREVNSYKLYLTARVDIKEFQNE